MNLFAMMAIVMVAAMATSCEKDKEGDSVKPAGPQYFSFSLKAGSAGDASYIATTSDLMKGNVSISGALEHIGRGYFIPADNYVYDINESENKILQFEMFPDGTVEEVASIMAAKYLPGGGQSRNVIDNNKYLFYIDPIEWGSREVKWLRIKLPEFVVDGNGTVELPMLNNDPAYMVNVGNTIVHGDKLVMGSIYYKAEGKKTIYAEGSHAIVFDWPTMANPKLISAPQTGQLGNVALSNYANDAAGNLYVSVGCDDLGQWDKPSVDKTQYGGLLRIKKGESDFDKDYFLDFSKEMGGVPTNIFNIFTATNNKAVAYIYNCEGVGWKVGNSDTGYYVTIDFGTGKVVKHDMPLSASVSTREALIFDNKFYSFQKQVSDNSTSVVEIDYNKMSADAWKMGAKVEGVDITSYGIAAHPVAAAE